MLTVINGDCLSVMPTLPDFDVVFADPPFNFGKKYDCFSDRASRDAYLGWSASWIAALPAKPDSSFYLCCPDEYAAELCLAARDCGWAMRNWIIWSYNFGNHLKSKWGRNKTHILYFARGKPHFLPGRVPSARQAKYNDKRADPAGRVPGDVWEFPRVCGTFKARVSHPCQMPVAPVARALLASCPPGGKVLDPFLGSGTTLVACASLGLEGVGIELSGAYCDLALSRLPEKEVCLVRR